jgi:hypothetical protein
MMVCSFSTRHEATNQEQPTAEMHTDAHSDEDTQHRTAQTERDEQDDVIHHPGDDMMGLDQADRLLEVDRRACDNFPPASTSWKQRQQPRGSVPYLMTRR